MTSIFENTKSKVTVHILHNDTLTDENRQKFIRTAEKYSQGLEFHDVTAYVASLSPQAKKIASYWTIGTMYRLFAPEILPELEKIIYLDCDVIVNIDISELWNVDLENKSLAAGLDVVSEVVRAYQYSVRNLQLRLIHVNPKMYFNAGVLVMNLQKIRSSCNFSEMILAWMTRYAHLLMFPDQDALNCIFSGDVKFLDSKFYTDKLNQNVSGCIFHMWRSKPWTKIRGLEHERLYWKYYLLSAWSGNNQPEDLIMKLSQIVSPPSPSQKSLKSSVIQFAKRSFHKMPVTIKETFYISRLLWRYVSHGMIRP